MEDTCFYAFDGKEKGTSDFAFVKSNNFSKVPDNAPQGQDKDGNKLWCAVAHTEKHGRVCGHAT